MRVSTSIRVSIVEDHAGTLAALVDLVSGWPGLVCVSHHRRATEALERIPAIRPDVVVVDLELPDMPGVALLRRFKEALPDTRLLVFSIHDDATLVFGAIEAGASGYWMKGGPPAELLQGICAVHRGEAVMHSSIARKVLAFFHQRGQVRAAAQMLTETEREILQLVAQGYTNKEIADRSQRSVRTVDAHFGNILSKLHAHTRAEAVAKYCGHSPGRGSA